MKFDTTKKKKKGKVGSGATNCWIKTKTNQRQNKTGTLKNKLEENWTGNKEQ
jgi:hypothetical protein